MVQDRKPLPSDDASEQETRLAQVLGEYHDRFAREEFWDAEDALDALDEILADTPGLAPALRTLAEVHHLVDETSPPSTLGDFEIVREAGSGGMGIVYEAQQRSLGRRVALKILRGGIDSKAVRRFKREARVAASLEHPNVVSVHCMGFDSRTPYYAMEFVEGETLKEILRRLKAESTKGGERRKTSTGSSFQETTEELPVFKTDSGTGTVPDGLSTVSLEPLVAGDQEGEKAGNGSRTKPPNGSYYTHLARIFADVADGLHYAHSKNVIHRDLKPSNLILDSCGRLRILDFGVAKVETETHQTGTEGPVGTLPYMSPEQARGRPERLGPGPDIYGLGATLYEMLVWRPPFSGGSYQQTFQQVLHRDPKPLRSRNPQVPGDLENIVLKCLNKDPGERYGTAEALGQDLRRFERGEPTEAKPPTVYEKLARRLKQNKWRILQLTACAVALLSGLILAANYLGELKREREERYGRLVRRGVVNILKEELLTPELDMGVMEHEVVTAVNLRRRPDVFLEIPSDVFEAGWAVAGTGAKLLDEAVKRLEEAVVTLDQKPDAHYHLARAFLRQGRWAEAKARLETALSLDPEFVPALSLKVAILERERDPGAAKVQARLSRITERPESPWSRSWREAHTAVMRREWERAAGAFKRLSGFGMKKPPHVGADVEALLGSGVAHFKTRKPEDLPFAMAAFLAGEWTLRGIEPTLFLGKIYYLMERREEAERIFQDLFAAAQARASGEPPSPDDVARGVALSYRELGDHGRALEWSRKMSASSPTRPRLEAEFLFRLGREQEALVAARRAYDGSKLETVITLANILHARGETEEATELYGQASSLAPSNPAPLVALGVCQAESDLSAARETLERALRLRPSEASAHYNLARILSRLGEKEEAKRHYEKVVAIQPGNAMALNNLGVLRYREGSLEEAKRLYGRATRASPTLAVAHYNLGWVLYRQWRYSEAADALSKADALGLENAAFLNLLGVCFQRLGKGTEASESYERAFKLDPEWWYTHHDLGTYRFATGQKESAVDAFRRALRDRPDDALLHLHLAWTLDDLSRNGGDPEKLVEAIDEYNAALEIDPKNVDAHMNLANLWLRENRPILTGGDLETWIRKLEDAVLLAGVDNSVPTLLEKCRRAFLPKVASYASIDALVDGPEIAVRETAVWNFHRGRKDPSTALEWTQLSFDDSSWERGPGPFGEPGTKGLGTVFRDMEGEYTSVYLRHRFSVPEHGQVQNLVLSVRAGCGFVAFLNGKEVARLYLADGKTRIPYDSVTDGRVWEPWNSRIFLIDESDLITAENVLAIQAVESNDGADFSLAAELSIFKKDRRQEAEARFKRFQAEADDESFTGRLAYFQGRLHELAGDFELAADSYRAVLDLDRSRPEPYLRLAECAQAQGDPAEAERALREGLASGLHHDRLWDRWLFFATVRLNRDLEGILSTIDSLATEDEEMPERPADLAWIVERLLAGEAIRINCGGTDNVTRDGIVWSRDRFFVSGKGTYLPKLDALRPRTDEQVLHAHEREFWIPQEWRFKILRGYAFPLPVGDYVVTLHFAEGCFEESGERIFDVLVEGQTFLEKYEPFEKSFGTADSSSKTVTVNDGILNIDFKSHNGNPKISAIEIERL